MIRTLEERRSWHLYAAQTRNLVGSRYYDVEPHDWAALQRSLLAIDRKYREKVAA